MWAVYLKKKTRNPSQKKGGNLIAMSKAEGGERRSGWTTSQKRRHEGSFEVL